MLYWSVAPWLEGMREPSLNWACWCFVVCHLAVYTKFIWLWVHNRRKWNPIDSYLSFEKLTEAILYAPLSAPAFELTFKTSIFWRASLRGIYHHNARPFHHTNDNWPSPAITPTIFYHSCEKENHSFISNNLAWDHVQVFAFVLWKAAKRNLSQIQHANMTQAGILKMKTNILQMYNPYLESINEFK